MTSLLSNPLVMISVMMSPVSIVVSTITAIKWNNHGFKEALPWFSVSLCLALVDAFIFYAILLGRS